MKTPLEMAQLRFRIAVQQALTAGVGAEQLRIIADEECANEVDYIADVADVTDAEIR